MDLTVAELVLLRATPWFGDALLGGPCAKSLICARAQKLLNSVTFDERIGLALLDKLLVKGLIERVSVGFIRRTQEGDIALRAGLKTLRKLQNSLVSGMW